MHVACNRKKIGTHHTALPHRGFPFTLSTIICIAKWTLNALICWPSYAILSSKKLTLELVRALRCLLARVAYARVECNIGVHIAKWNKLRGNSKHSEQSLRPASQALIFYVCNDKIILKTSLSLIYRFA